MGNRPLLSIADKLLLAAYDLEESGHRPFSAEDLVVAAWRKFPDAFGLAGYRDADGTLLYPDSNRVFAEIMGTKPMRSRGLLAKVGNKMYQLTEAGREYVRLLASRSGAPYIERAGLAREVQSELKRLLVSRANEKYRSGRLADLTFPDACAFWRISPRSSAIELQGRLANFSAVLTTAKTAIQRQALTFEHGGQTFSVQDLDGLLHLHGHLLERFQTEIAVIQKRTDERL